MKILQWWGWIDGVILHDSARWWEGLPSNVTYALISTALNEDKLGLVHNHMILLLTDRLCLDKPTTAYGQVQISDRYGTHVVLSIRVSLCYYCFFFDIHMQFQ